MKSELIVDVQPKEVSIALIEDDRLVEFQKEGRDANFSVGNIYLAKVRKLMPGVNACFVNLGYERDAFLHYLDLGPDYRASEKLLKQAQSDRKHLPDLGRIPLRHELEKEGSIKDSLSAGQDVLVQIIKEPINTKGPRLTCQLSFAGRFLVLLPFEDKVNVSTKIRSSEERKRLKRLIESIKPKNFGVIVRTVAEGKRVAELDKEMKILVKRWETTIQNVQKAKDTPKLVYEETSRTVGLLRDLFNPSFEDIHVNDKQTCDEIKDYISLIAPDAGDIVHYYNDKAPIFDHFNVTRQVKAAFGRTVTYKHGAYLIIESTEALHVIDVNSGNRAKNPDGQEANALEVNLGAADEIARQLRLRDIGGIIVIDFIDMAKAENRQALYERMTQNMKSDRARHNILPLSKFCLMQITRQRVRPAMEVHVEETCPSCFGTGVVKSSLLFTDKLESKIAMLVQQLNVKKLSLHVHPYVAAYINKGFFSLKMKWQLKYGRGVKVIPNQSLAFLQYKFYDADNQEIDMKEDADMK